VYSCFYPAGEGPFGAGFESVPSNSPELAQPISGEITTLSNHSSSVGRPVHARLPLPVAVYSCFYPAGEGPFRAGFESVPGNSPELAQPISGEITALSNQATTQTLWFVIRGSRVVVRGAI
jgi:hypothetical protein